MAESGLKGIRRHWWYAPLGIVHHPRVCVLSSASAVMCMPFMRSDVDGNSLTENVPATKQMLIIRVACPGPRGLGMLHWTSWQHTRAGVL